MVIYDQLEKILNIQKLVLVMAIYRLMSTFKNVITSLTTLLALFSIYILGGEILRGFSFAMILGVLIGTYSSIFVASPILKILKVSSKTLEKEEESIVP